MRTDIKDYKQDIFMKSLLDGIVEISNDEIAERAKRLDLNIISRPMKVLMIASDFSNIKFASKDDYLIEAEKIVSGICGENMIYSCIDSYYHIVLVLDMEDYMLFADFNRLCSGIMNQLNKKFGITCIIGSGKLVRTFKDLPLSNASAQEMLVYKRTFLHGGIADADQITVDNKVVPVVNNIYFDRVIGCFEDGNIPKMGVRLDEFIAYERSRPNAAHNNIKRNFVELTIRVINIVSNYGVDVDSALGDIEPYRFIMSQKHTEVIRDWFIEFCQKLLDQMDNKNKKQDDALFKELESFIQNNFTDPQFSLQDAASDTNLSPQYLSKIFKKQYGIGFNEYVNNIRVNKAEVMLRETNYSSKEISSKCGFSTAAYFTQVFKKYRDMTPAVYKKKYGYIKKE